MRRWPSVMVIVFKTLRWKPTITGDTWWIAQGDGWGDIQVEATAAGILASQRLDYPCVLAYGETDGMTSECREVTQEEALRAMDSIRAGCWG